MELERIAMVNQPEDDLDNHLIYDLIVGQLREVKRRRQVRETICQVMEGGSEAFRQRYRRIVLEGRHV